MVGAPSLAGHRPQLLVFGGLLGVNLLLVILTFALGLHEEMPGGQELPPPLDAMPASSGSQSSA